MQETTNLGLELYEPTDNANLEDGYNVSMRKLDQRDGEVSTLISALNTTVSSFDGRITNAQSDATSALTIGTEAAATAGTAATNATQALTQLAGAHFDHIANSDLNAKWTAGNWASGYVAINAFVIYDETTDEGLMMGGFYATSTATTATTAWQSLKIARFTDWVPDNTQGHDDYNDVVVVNNDWAENASCVSRLDSDGYLYWTPFRTASNVLPANEAVTGSFVFAVKKRA